MSSNHEDPEFECEFGCEPMDHGIGIEDELDDPWVSGSIMIDPNDAGATGVYNKMVSRAVDGSDPLVPEPGPGK
jgi:hypothetical protein